jgi:putative flippase GtrA
MVAAQETAMTARARLAQSLRHLADRLGDAKQVLLRWVPDRFHAITDELAKFGTIGLINLGVNIGVFNLLLLLPLTDGSEVKSKAVATVVATTSAYFLNRHWTYRNRPKSTLRREYTLFFFFNAVGLVIETGFVALAKYGLDLTNLVWLNVFSILGIAVGTAFRFWAYRTHVFKLGDDLASDEAEPARAGAAPGAPLATVGVISLAKPAGDAATRGMEDDRLADELVQLELDDLVQDEFVDDKFRR